MRATLLALVACGGAPSTSLTTSPTEALPDHLADHQHTAPAHADDPSKLYVEVTSDSEHGETLRRSTTAQLEAVPYVTLVDAGGDLELHVELAALTAADCKVKIFVLRLPQHDLLALADGSAHATGTTGDACVATLDTTLVRDKLPAVLQQQLAAKR
jgi:hypothetical protein